ncbi:MAG: 2OG-Fe(II) oxygenase [Gammaproteobacteria bacterium]|nr:2OG-Fe(II) oxygenase [Gammaproteobacteria bacterium]
MTTELLHIERYPMHALESAAGQALVAGSRERLQTRGSFNLPGFLQPRALRDCVAELQPLLASTAYRHAQDHDIYFSKTPPHPPPPAEVLKKLTSSNHTLTCDQLAGTLIRQIYEWRPLCDFLARVFETSHLYPMADPLARLNVMGYGSGDRLNWHFDRAKYTVTLLLQEAARGGVFEYRRNLRSDSDPNYSGVARLLAGEDDQIETFTVRAGTLSVFAGRYAAHSITPVEGETMRIIAVLSFVDEPDYRFSEQDRRQFYGRAEPVPG